MIKTHFTTMALVLSMVTSIHAQTYKVLYNFGSHPGDPSAPLGTIVQSPGGNLYTAAIDAFTDDVGSAFKIRTDGTVTVIHYFNNDIDGQWPRGGLTFATDQQFHGTTQGSGSSFTRFSHGTIFRMTPDGKIKTMYSFTGGLDGGGPENPPIQSVSGNYYGTTPGEVGFNGGSIYKITEGGKFTLLHTFNGGDNPSGTLIQGTDFGFYGVAEGVGGPDNNGVLFRCSSGGDFTILHYFDGIHGLVPNGALVQANDSNFYGTTFAGGSTGNGVIYRLTPGLVYTVLHNFSGGSDGESPGTGLLEASDGNLYGTTIRGGTHAYGVLFRITPAGVFTVLHDFQPGIGGGSLQSPLMQHTNGMLYGTTVNGGTDQNGTFFRLDAGLPPFVTFLTVYGRVGAHVVILGQHFTNESVVSFNGVPAENPEIHPTYIKAIVPDGATTGPITVTTTTGTLTSNKPFVIH